jgi:hypothetical protein
MRQIPQLYNLGGGWMPRIVAQHEAQRDGAKLCEAALLHAPFSGHFFRNLPAFSSRRVISSSSFSTGNGDFLERCRLYGFHLLRFTSTWKTIWSGSSRTALVVIVVTLLCRLSIN